MNPGLESAARSLERIIDSIGTTHVERIDRVRLHETFNQICSHRSDLQRECERVIMLASSCAVPMNTQDRAEIIDRIKAMIRLLVNACLS